MRFPAHRVCIALSVLLAACSASSVANVPTVTEPAVITLKANPGSGSVVSLQIEGDGSIDGFALIELMLNGKPYRTERLQGSVAFTWGGDWYAPTAEVRYRPENVQGGRLQLRYRFQSLER